MLFYIESNLTSLEGKLKYANSAITPENFIKLISSVIYIRSHSERATATFVAGKYLLTAAGFLFFGHYNKEDIDISGRILPDILGTGTNLIGYLLTVEKIYHPKKENKDDYRKEPAILEVSYCVKGL